VQALQPLGGPDLALARVHHDDDAVGAEHLVAVLVEGLDVLVALRQLLVEAGVHPQLYGKCRHQQGEDGQRSERQRTPTEEKAFEPLDQGFDHLGVIPEEARDAPGTISRPGASNGSCAASLPAQKV